VTVRRAVVVALALAAGPAPAAVLDSSAAGFTVENSIVVPVDARAAWRGLVDHVDRWWPKDHSWFGADGKFTIDARAGGCFCERAGARQALHMTVSHVDPRQLLRMVGGLGPLQGMGLHGALEFTLAPAEGGTRVTMRYVAGGYSASDLAKLAPVVDRVQATQLGGLEAFLKKRG
jgi:uncharacterized protein YndB with AHSA1/START domain